MAFTQILLALALVIIPASDAPTTPVITVSADSTWEVGTSTASSVSPETIRKDALAKRGFRVSADGNHVLPMKPGTYRITSTFGHRAAPCQGCSTMHNGLDFAAPLGTPIYAPGAGVVTYVGNGHRGYGLSGWVVAVKLDSGVTVTANHMGASDVTVQVGQRVQTGDQIGRVNTIGFSTGPHLHFSVWEGTTAINPKIWFERVGF